MHISESEAQKGLRHVLDDIRTIIQGGWEEYMVDYPEKQRLIHCSTTRANIVHNHQVQRASAYAIKNKQLGINHVNLSRLHVLLVNNRFAIRFKKLNSEKKSSNLITDQVKAFMTQESLDGIENTIHLDAGYVLSNDEQSITNIYLVCPNGTKSKPFWAIELLEEGNQTK